MIAGQTRFKPPTNSRNMSTTHQIEKSSITHPQTSCYNPLLQPAPVPLPLPHSAADPKLQNLATGLAETETQIRDNSRKRERKKGKRQRHKRNGGMKGL